MVTADARTTAQAAARQLLKTMEGGKKFPIDVASEWIQPLSPHTEYDDDTVGATGWVVHPRVVGGDVPFNHPFQNSINGTPFDYEFELALDRPAGDPSHFDFLLTPGNKAPTTNPDPTDDRVPDEKFARDLNLNFPLGLLGVEIDAGNVPRGFINNVQGGNRMAVFGRWIIDSGHALTTESHGQVQRAEIHPPLLMAAASNPAPDTTRVLFTSRPFLVANTFTTDQGKVYDDNASDDGTLFTHLLKEVAKANENILGVPVGSVLVEAHPKIKSFPFRGVHLMHFLVRPPAPPPTHFGQLPGLRHLEVSFRFTVRSGCAVQVTASAADTIDVFVVMNQVGYKPPHLPPNSGRRWSREELARLDPEAGSAYLGAEIVSGALQLLTGGVLSAGVVELILSRGLQTDAYASLNDAVDILSREGAVTNAKANSIPPKAGITLNDAQPFPVYGWLEAKWVQNPIVVHQ